MTGYYYLHTNGDLIYKPAIVVESEPGYFDSDFVKKFWCFNSADRKGPWTIALESLAMGARIERVKELAGKWGLTLEDFYEFMMRSAPTEEVAAGIIIFAEKILGIPEEDFWDKMKAHNESKKGELKCQQT